MNREIKFRAWDKKKEVMLTDVGLVETSGGFGNAVYGAQGSWGFKRSYAYGNAVVEPEKWGSPDDLVWMQYTGLKDKSGKEIYEGDLINMHYRNLSVEKGEVVSVEMGMTYDSDGTVDEKVYGWLAGKSSLVDVAPYAEILGNIYENKGLLT